MYMYMYVINIECEITIHSEKCQDQVTKMCRDTTNTEPVSETGLMMSYNYYILLP